MSNIFFVVTDLDSKGLLQRARNSRYGMDRNHSSRNYDSGEMTARSGKSHSTETGNLKSLQNIKNINNLIL